ncbi:type II toxin-antitoxin system PemK/MazF family toxin [Mariprofundus ferrooxydans]|nr:type II toxin-antitoxin system PemK/MazF family toxin [Mariprofundus ferrooxydans]
MSRYTVTFNAFDVMVVPFPFTDSATTKRRPVLVLSDSTNFNQPVGQSVLAMITGAANSDWPLDIEINDLDAAGLSSPSIVRMKIFTLDHQFIVQKSRDTE